MARAPVNTNLGGGELPRPMASPMGISAPVATVQESGLMGLARSLSAINPTLQGFIQESQDLYREREAERAYDTIQGMTFEQAKAAVDAGTMRGTESPWFRAAFQKQFGLAHASNRRREIITAYNTTFDKQNGNLDEFLAAYAQEDNEAYGGSDFIASGMREGMSGVFDTIRNQHAEYRDLQLQGRAADQFYTLARDAVTTASSEGGDVNAAISAVVAEHQALGLIDQDKADAALLGLAEEFSQSGDVNALEAVLNADPYGRGSFSSRSGFATKSQTLLERAKANAADQYRVANIEPRAALELRAASGGMDDGDLTQVKTWVESGQMTPDQAESLINQNAVANVKRLNEAGEANARTAVLGSATQLILAGQGSAVQDITITLPDGTVKDITGKELRETVINEQITALTSGENASVAVAAQQLASWGAPENFKPWESALTNGYTSLTAALTKPDKDGKVNIPVPAQQAYTLWREMEGTPAVRERHIKDSTAASVYRDAETLEKMGGLPPEEALIAAASIDRKSSRTGIATSVNRQEFEQAIKGHLSGGLFGTDPINAQVVGLAVEEHARILMDLGIPQDRAIEKAVESFDTSFTLINGVYVNTRDRFVPGDIEAISSAVVDDFLKANPDNDEGYFSPDQTQDYWTITDQWGTPLRGAPRIHVSELPQYLTNRNREAANTAIRENQ
jgi:hypothetical protein